ncbi:MULTISPECIES: hypothetical protein [unclassified Undibacterium]|uniref:hypothetical protein n=1 Tax=unclassified Undibacterium TaxID=2630295 RepID=UPI003C2E110A
MKKALLVMSLISALSACGGGSSGSGSNSGNNSGTGGTGGTSGTGSTSSGMTEAMKVFAESWISMQAVLNLHDLLIMAGNNGNCPKGGSVSFNGSTTSLSNCVRRFPADNAYLGNFSGTPVFTGSVKSLNFQSAGNLNVNAGDNPAVTQYVMSNTSFNGTDNDTGSGDTSQIGNGSATFVMGAASSYAVTSVGSTAVNNGSSLNSNAGFFYSKSNAAASRVVTTQNLIFSSDTSGMTNRPASGSYNVAVGGTTTSCVNVGVQMLANNQVKISCSATSESRTVNWSDTDVQSALRSARS